MSKIPQTSQLLLDVIKQRWSARSFQDTHIEPEILQSLFEAASWASSSMNEQPWRFIYGALGTETHRLIAQSLSVGNALWATKAPVLVAVVSKDVFTSNNAPNIHAWHDVGAAEILLLLQAASLGIYGHQMGGFDRNKATETLGIPENYSIVAMLALGYLGSPEQLDEPFKTREVTPRSRKPISEIAFESASSFTSSVL